MTSLHPFPWPVPLGDLLSHRVVDGTMRVDGEVDAFTASTFGGFLAEAIHRPDVSVVDLGGVTFFDSRGAGVLERFELHRSRRVLGSPAVAKVLRILGKPWLLTDLSDVA